MIPGKYLLAESWLFQVSEGRALSIAEAMRAFCNWSRFAVCGIFVMLFALTFAQALIFLFAHVLWSPCLHEDSIHIQNPFKKRLRQSLNEVKKGRTTLLFFGLVVYEIRIVHFAWRSSCIQIYLKSLWVYLTICSALVINWRSLAMDLATTNSLIGVSASYFPTHSLDTPVKPAAKSHKDGTLV